MNIKAYFGKSLVVTAVAILSFGLLASVAFAAITSLDLTAPTGGQDWSGTQNITWTQTGGVSGDTVSVLLSTDSGGSYNEVIATGVDVTGLSYSWDTNSTAAGPLADGSTYRVRITDGAIGLDSSGSDFTVDNTAPTLTIVDGTETGPVMTDTINVTTVDATSGVASQEYGFSADNVCDATDTYGNAFTSGVDFDIMGDYTDYLCVTATDNAGNTGYELVGQLNTDNTLPSILSYTLNGGTIDAHFNPGSDTVAIEITADESVTWTTVRVQDVTTSSIERTYFPGIPGTTISLSWDGSVSTGGPLQDGAYELFYTIEDLAGNITGPIAGPLGSHHIVVDTVDPVMTSVVATTIEGGGDTIEITFSEDVVPEDGDWTDGNEFVYESPNGVPLNISNADFSFNSGSNVLTVTLDELTDASWLKNGDVVNVLPTLNFVDDLADNVLITSGSDSSVSGDVDTPSVALTYDIDRQVKDADTIVITATFDEDMENTPQIAIATLGDGSLVATNMMPAGGDRSVWTYDWNVPAGSDDDGTATITIAGEDLAGNIMTDATNTRVIDNTDPIIASFTKPVVDTVYRVGTILTFTASDTGTGTGPVCTYSLNGGADVVIACTETDLSITGLLEGRNTIEVTITDEAGNTDSDGPVSFVYDTDGILTVDDTPATNPDFDTLQGAVSAWVTGITTVDIASGNYTEAGQILIDMDLVVTGDSISKPVITPAADFIGTNAADAWILVDENITFSLDNVVLDGGAQFVYQAIRSHGNSTIDEVDFKNIVGSVSGTPYRGVAISSFGGEIAYGAGTDSHGVGLAANNLTLTNSTFENIGRIGAVIKGDAATATITGNTYTGKGVGDWLDYAFEVGSDGQALIEGNTISDNLGVASTDGSTSAGVFIASPLGTASGATVDENTFTNNYTAIRVGYDATDLSVVTARYNNMSSTNDFGIYSSTPLVDAERNWWGDATGPLHTTDNTVGLGAEASDDVDFSPFCLTVPVGASCDLGSIDPIASFDLDFDPDPQAVGNPSTLTITAEDASGYLVVNDTTTKVKLDADSGASFGATPVTMEADGVVVTTIINTVVGTVNVTAEEWPGGPATGIGTVEFIAGSDVTAPTVSDIQATSITTTGSTITWDTNENATSRVEYGLTSSYGSFTAVDATADNMTHAVALSGLMPGTDYHFRVISTDGSGNTTTSGDNIFTTVASSDTTPPVITLLGQNPLTLTVGDAYVEAGATASDDTDGDISGSIVIDASAVNMSVAGTYTVTYDVSDVATNAAVQEVRTVIVNDSGVDVTAPVITLLGQNPITLTVGDTFNDPGATANDNADGDISGSITFGGTITDGFVTVAAGTYTVTYDVSDAAANAATQETRTVIVNAAFDDTASLAVTGIDAVKTYATADDTYANGWSWKYYVTVPTSETQFQMKFSDFLSGANSIAAANNIRFYTAQASANADDTNAVTITAPDTYSTVVTLDSDLDAGTAGRQIEVIVEMKVPVGSAGGSYSGSYGVQSN